MNPEFQRNLWLELSPRRMILMVVLLALAFVAVAIGGGKDFTIGGAAEWLFYLIVVVWGTRNAATAVVGEIRDRTWDMQLLSSLTPGEMTWGKLFGATIFNWFGGAICLAVLTFDNFAHKGVAAALADIAYYVVIGLIAQAASLLASLIAVRRRQAHSRLDVFLYQVVGIAAAFAVNSVWSMADPATMHLAHVVGTDVIAWWNMKLDARAFMLASLAIFALWLLVGCYREMRLELSMRNGALVWLAFLVFIGIYAAGFDAQSGTRLPIDIARVAPGDIGLRLAKATGIYACLTYLMVFLEPKDSVLYRWLGAQIASGRIAAFFGGLQAWMMAYAATLLCGVGLAVWAQLHRVAPWVDVATLGFVTRDVSIFVLFQSARGQRRGDFAALGTLFALYVLVPVIGKALGGESLSMLVLPEATQPYWLGPLAAWGEGLAVAALAFSRVSIRNSPAGRSAPSPAS
jgi:hypothetical protein